MDGVAVERNLRGKDVGVRWGQCSWERGLSRRKKEGKKGVQSSRNLGEDRDQPFSFTVGDPGSLWGGITCRRVDRRHHITGLTQGIHRQLLDCK